LNKLIELAVTTGVAELVKDCVNMYIKPKLESINLTNSIALEEKFNEYIFRSYNKHLYMNTIVFKNQQKTINDLYIPLTVIKNDDKRSEHAEMISINTFPSDFMPKYGKILLIDSAGMGKSTIIKYLYLLSLKCNKGVPILIELRKLGKDDSIIDFIMDEINGISKEFKKKEICSLIESGDFIFFFDGYDEIIDENKSIVTDNLQSFISKADKNLFIISSREESSLSCFGNFQRFDIRPLNKIEAYSLIKKYDNDGDLSKQLINKLETEENLKIINEFLTNPLMVSLLYKAFEYKASIPYKKNIFYRQVYDALFEDHDRSKGSAYVHEKRSKLDIEDFYTIMKILGFLTLKVGISYSKDEIINFLKKCKKLAIGINFSENDFVYDMVNSVPLFVKEGIEYKWIHKSFQEYFAANYICIDAKEKESTYLTQMINSNSVDGYYNVLDFCYDIDYKEFRKTIIYPIIKDYIQYYNNSYTDSIYSKYNSTDLDIRKSINFIYRENYIRKVDISDIPKLEFDEFFKEWKSFSQKHCIAAIHSSGLCLGVVENYIGSVILKLLFGKQSSIVKKYNRNNIDSKEVHLVDEIPEGEYCINDDRENILNNENVFGLVNNFVILSRPLKRNPPIVFDYNECLNIKNEIEEEIRFEKEDLLFL
jgi:hypothetical protein